MKKIIFIISLIFLTKSFPVWAQLLDSDNDVEVEQQTEEQQEVKEKKYVTDKLRLSLYKKADSNSGTLKLLISGDVLDVLEKRGPYSKVRTVEGVTGWVKNGFLVSIPTASYLLIEEQKKNEELNLKLEKFSDTQKIIGEYENTISQIKVDKELTLEELGTTKQELEKIKQIKAELAEELEISMRKDSTLNLQKIILIIKKYWYVLLIILLIFFLTGFLSGKNMVQAQIRKRFQGVRVL